MIERYSRPRMKKIWSEKNKFDKWLQIEIAVCQAWTDIGHIPKETMPKIRKASYDLGRVAEFLRVNHHDMIAFLNSVAESLGKESRFIHMGLTSSDIMDTALSLQLVEACHILEQDITELISVISNKALEHKRTMIIGRTHGIHAEPTTFGLKLALWHEEMKRNAHRLTEAETAISVGKISGAVGTYANVPPEIEQITCASIGLTPAPVSSQIIQRDRHAQFITTLALIASSLEKFATEIRNLQRTEIAEAEEPFQEGQTGSSAMPHKKNPELCERICGLARLVRGYASTSLENLALWHERDISHSSCERVILPDACLVVDYMLTTFTSIIRKLGVFPDNMQRNIKLTKGLIFSQRVMLSLIDKGLSRGQSYEIVQHDAMQAWRGKENFLDLLKADPLVTSHLSQAELESLCDYNYYLKYVDDIFERLGLTKTIKLQQAEEGELSPHAL